MSDRSHLSIGEVLSLLQDEFPDVTISKIRFLESQGLLDPERTPSGYRKFYEPDIDQLRWILRQQRENFLPLKVIKDRLAEVPLEELLASDGAAVVEATLPIEGLGEPATVPAGASGQADGAATPPPPPPPPPIAAPSPPAADPARAPAAAAGSASRPALLEQELTRSSGSRARGREPAPADAAPAPAPAETKPSNSSLLDTGESSMNLTAEELVRATGLTSRQLTELESYGLIAGDSIDNVTYYRDDALIVGRTAAAFMRHGVEARHLRMYKVAAEREAGFLEQLILPLLKQRNPNTRHDAVALLDDMVGLGDTLRQAMLRQALRDYLDRR